MTYVPLFKAFYRPFFPLKVSNLNLFGQLCVKKTIGTPHKSQLRGIPAHRTLELLQNAISHFLDTKF